MNLFSILDAVGTHSLLLPGVKDRQDGVSVCDTRFCLSIPFGPALLPIGFVMQIDSSVWNRLPKLSLEEKDLLISCFMETLPLQIFPDGLLFPDGFI